MRCSSVGALLTRRELGLSDAERLHVEQHLEGCAECRFDSQALSGLVKAIQETSIDGVADAALRRAFAEPVGPESSAPKHLRWRVGFGLATAAAAAAGLVLWLSFGSATPERVVGVAALKESGRFVSDDVRQLQIAHADVRALDGAILAWAGSVVTLETGRLAVEVDPHRHRPFEVHAPRFTVRVTGTRFEVSSSGWVRVTRGTVQILSPAGDVLRQRVSAGETWAFEFESASESAFETESESESETASESGSGSETESETETETETESASASESGRILAADEARAGRESLRPRPSAHGGSARERFERAVRVQLTDPRQAVALLSALEREGGPWAANALFARGQLERSRGRLSEARALFERYLRRHPGGLNAPDARAMLGD